MSACASGEWRPRRWGRGERERPGASPYGVGEWQRLEKEDGEATGVAPTMANDVGVRALGRCVSGDGGWNQTRGRGGDEAVRWGGGAGEVVVGRGGDGGHRRCRGGANGGERRCAAPIWIGMRGRDEGGSEGNLG